MKRYGFVPLEERIVLDAAAVPTAAAVAHAGPNAASPAAPAIEGPHVLVVPTNINYVAGLEGAAKDGVVVVAYDPAHETLSQLSSDISKALGGQQAASIGFVEQGISGGFSLLNSLTVNTDNLSSASNGLAQFWHQVASNIQANGQLDIIACDVAQGSHGQEFVQILSQIINDTGSAITVNAATSLVGSDRLGGSWILQSPNQVDVGSVYFDSSQLATWNHTLDVTDSISFTAGAITSDLGNVGGATITQLYPGATIDYAVTVTNTGTDVLNGLYQIIIDPSLTYVTNSGHSSMGDTVSYGQIGSDNILRFNINDGVNPGGIDTISFNVTVNSNVVYGSSFATSMDLAGFLNGVNSGQPLTQSYNYASETGVTPEAFAVLTITPVNDVNNPLLLGPGFTPSLDFNASLPAAFQQTIDFGDVFITGGTAYGFTTGDTGINLTFNPGQASEVIAIPTVYNTLNSFPSSSSVVPLSVDISVNQTPDVNQGSPLTNSPNGPATATGYLDNMIVSTNFTADAVTSDGGNIGGAAINQLYPGATVDFTFTITNSGTVSLEGGYQINVGPGLTISGSSSPTSSLGDSFLVGNNTISVAIPNALGVNASDIVTFKATLNDDIGFGASFGGNSVQMILQAVGIPTANDTAPPYQFSQTPESYTIVTLTGPSTPAVVSYGSLATLDFTPSLPVGVVYQQSIDVGALQVTGGVAGSLNYLNDSGDQAYPNGAFITNITIPGGQNSYIIQVPISYNPANLTAFPQPVDLQVAIILDPLNPNTSPTALGDIETTPPVTLDVTITDSNPNAAAGTAMVLDQITTTYTLTNTTGVVVDGATLNVFLNGLGATLDTNTIIVSQGSTSTLSGFVWSIGSLASNATASLSFVQTVNITTGNGVPLQGYAEIQGNYEIPPVPAYPNGIAIDYFSSNPVVDSFTPVPSVSVTPNPVTADAGDSIQFQVQLSNYYFQEIDVIYHTDPGTAIAGVNYTDTSGTLQFFQNLVVGVTPAIFQNITVPTIVAPTLPLGGSLSFTFTAEQPTSPSSPPNNPADVVVPITLNTVPFPQLVQDSEVFTVYDPSTNTTTNIPIGVIIPPSVIDGDVLTYTFAFRNSGNTILNPTLSATFVDPSITLTNVTVSEGTLIFTQQNGISVTGVTLDPGEIFTFTVTETVNADVASGTIINLHTNPSNNAIFGDNVNVAVGFQYAEALATDPIRVIGTVVSSPENTVGSYTPPLTLLVPGNIVDYSFAVKNAGTDSFGGTVIAVTIDTAHLTLDTNSIVDTFGSTFTLTPTGFNISPSATFAAGAVDTVTFSAMINTFTTTATIGDVTAAVTAFDSSTNAEINGAGNAAGFTTSLPSITITPFNSPVTDFENSQPGLQFEVTIGNAYTQNIDFGAWTITGGTAIGSYLNGSGSAAYALNQLGSDVMVQAGQTSVIFTIPTYYNALNPASVTLTVGAYGANATGLINTQTPPTVEFTQTILDVSHPGSTTAMIGDVLQGTITITNTSQLALDNLNILAQLDSANTYNYQIISTSLGGASLAGSTITWVGTGSTLLPGATATLVFTEQVYYNISDGHQVGSQVSDLNVTYLGQAFSENSTNQTIATFTPVPTVTIVDNALIVKAGNSLQGFQVQLSSPYWENYVVHYETVNGTAIGGINYQNLSGDMTFTPGTIAPGQTLLLSPAIQTFNNVGFDTSKSFFVEFSAVDPNLGNSVPIQATATIQGPVTTSAPPSPWNNNHDSFLPQGVAFAQFLLNENILGNAGFGGHFADSLNNFVNGQSHFTSYSLSGFINQPLAFGDPGIGLVPPVFTVVGDKIEGTFELYLDTPPMHDVTVTITGSEGDIIIPSIIHFTPDNWSNPQTVRFTENLKDSAGKVHRIIMQTVSEDYDYNGINMPIIATPPSDNKVGVGASIFEFNNLSMAGSYVVEM